MTGLLQVATATADREAAITLVSEAVRRRLAVSAQVNGPVTSVYWHLGEFGTGEEWQAVMLTTQERYADLEAFLLTEHPWQTRRSRQRRSSLRLRPVWRGRTLQRSSAGLGQRSAEVS